MQDIFAQATRKKLRFQTPVGNLTTEQLWDLPLETGTTNLFDLATAIQAQLDSEKKPAKALSFFKKAKSTDTIAELQFEIVKHIVTTKVAEIEDKTAQAVKQTEIAELDKLIAAKEAEAKANLTLDELMKLKAKLAK